MHLISVCLLLLIVIIGSITSIDYTCDRSASCGCSTVTTASVNSRIVGGEEADNRAFGWIVSLQYNRRHICGASLISPEFAITAAHCINDFTSSSISQLSILAGTNYLDAASNAIAQRRTIITIYKHPNYQPSTFRNDIALIRFSALTTDVSSTLSFICVPDANQDPFVDGTKLVAIGWGVTAEGSVSVPDALRQVTVDVFPSSSADCVRAPIRDSTLQFCAGVNGGGKGTVPRFEEEHKQAREMIRLLQILVKAIVVDH
jgi:secreted trypsin-like serine protease